MKTLSSVEITYISGGFSLTDFVESCVTGAFIGGTIGIFSGGAGVIPCACAGATVFGIIDLIYQSAVSVNQSFYNNNNQYNQGCYPGYYYAY